MVIWTHWRLQRRERERASEAFEGLGTEVSGLRDLQVGEPPRGRPLRLRRLSAGGGGGGAGLRLVPLVFCRRCSATSGGAARFRLVPPVFCRRCSATTAGLRLRFPVFWRRCSATDDGLRLLLPVLGGVFSISNLLETCHDRRWPPPRSEGGAPSWLLQADQRWSPRHHGARGVRRRRAPPRRLHAKERGP